MRTIAIIVAAVIVVVLGWVIATYNRFIRLQREADQAMSNIDVQLKRRADLIPNLVEVVRGYATHESATFERVTSARAAALAAHDPHARAAADGQMQQALGGLFAVAEHYPDLRASENFMLLQRQLEQTENLIAGSRGMHNVAVRLLNTGIQQAPANVIAGLFHVRPREMYRAEDDERHTPAARFSPAEAPDEARP